MSTDQTKPTEVAPADDKPAISPTTPNPALPSLTNETWELLEFRMWAKFSHKLWAVVGAFLTVVSLAGLLGVPAYIDSKLQAKLQHLEAQVRETQQQFAVREAKVVLTGEVATYLSSILQKDIRTYMHLLEDAQSEIEKNSHLQSPLSPLQIENLKAVHSKLAFLSEHPDGLRAFPHVANRIFADAQFKLGQNDWWAKYDEKVTRDQWEKFKTNCEQHSLASLYEAAEMLPHLIALERSHEKVIASLLGPEFQSAISKADLFQIYEKVAIPEYKTSFAKAHLPFESRSAFSFWSWSNLSDFASSQFFVFELDQRGDKQTPAE